MDLVENPEDRFSHDEAHIICTFLASIFQTCSIQNCVMMLLTEAKIVTNEENDRNLKSALQFAKMI